MSDGSTTFEREREGSGHLAPGHKYRNIDDCLSQLRARYAMLMSMGVFVLVWFLQSRRCLCHEGPEQVQVTRTTW